MLSCGMAAVMPVSSVTAVLLRRLIIVSNVLPIRGRKEAHGWEFEWDQDALVAQAKVGRQGPNSAYARQCQKEHSLCFLATRLAGCRMTALAAAANQMQGNPNTWYKQRAQHQQTLCELMCVCVCVQEGIPEEYDVVYVGSLSVDVDPREQDVSHEGERQCSCRRQQPQLVAYVRIRAAVRVWRHKGQMGQQSGVAVSAGCKLQRGSVRATISRFAAQQRQDKRDNGGSAAGLAVSSAAAALITQCTPLCAAKRMISQGSTCAAVCCLLVFVQDVSVQLKQMYNCAPVFIDQDVRDKYYKGMTPCS